MFRNECSDAKKKTTQFFHGISTMRFLDHPILLMLQKQFHPGFWLTFPSIFQSPFSHPIAGYVFFFNVNGSNPKQMRTGGATHFPKRSRRHPGPGHAKADGDEFHQLATGWGCTGQHWSWRSQGDARGGWGWTYGEEKHGKTRGECLEGLPSGNLT